jgi:hypothetical protein
MYITNENDLILDSDEEIIDLLVDSFKSEGVFIPNELMALDNVSDLDITLEKGIDYDIEDISNALKIFFKKNWNNKEIFTQEEFDSFEEIYKSKTNKKTLDVKANDYSEENMEKLINKEFKKNYDKKNKKKLKQIKKLLM